MTLAINVTTPEGMVFAADTRFTHRSRAGHPRVGSDSMSKILPVGPRMAVVFAGFPFLEKDGEQVTTTSLIKGRARELGPGASIDDVSDQLLEEFREPFELQYRKSLTAQQATEMLQLQGATHISIDESQVPFRASFRDRSGRDRTTMLGNDRHLTLLVGGYESDGRSLLYRLDVPNNRVVCVDSDSPSRKYGSTWVGQAEVLMRLVAGYDPRILSIPIMQEVAARQGAEGLQEQLQSVHYVVNWGLMTLQDAVDFAVMALRVTSEMQRFADGIRSSPGGVQAVGPDAHVAVISPEAGYEWVRRPEVQVQQVI